MKTYKITVKTTNGDISYLSEGASLEGMTSIIKTKYQGQEDVHMYTVEPTVKEIPYDAMQGLYNASAGLIACLVFLCFAEYRIRKWLQS